MRTQFGKKNIIQNVLLFIREYVDKSTNKALIITIISLFFIINYAVRIIPFRLDLTENNAYSLSSGTKKILRDLDDIVNITLYISSDLPTRLTVLEREVKDFLDEYRRNSKKSFVTIKTKDPKKDETALQEVRDFGVPELQFSQIENDKYAVSSTYFGMVIQYGAKSELIPSVTNPETLEYDITSAIYRLTKKEKASIGIAGVPSFASPQEDEIGAIRQILQRDYDIEYPFENENDKNIPKKISTMLIFGKNTVYTEAEIKALEKHIESGKSLIVIAQGISVADDLQSSEASHNLFKLLSKYGLSLEKKFVLSASSELANFSTGTVTYFVPYPFWIKTGQFNTEAGELSNVGYLMFPWASPVTKKDIKNIKFTTLVNTEDYSWTLESNASLNPNEISEPKKEDLKQIPLIYRVKKNNGSLILIPSEKFLDTRFVSRAQGNIEFVFNLISVLSSDGLLSGIRSRQARIVPLKQISDSAKDIVKYGSIGVLPGLCAFIGIAYLLKRR